MVWVQEDLNPEANAVDSAGLSADRNLRLVAQVTWVGRSSLEVAAEALTLDPGQGAWAPRLTARFVVVRCPVGT